MSFTANPKSQLSQFLLSLLLGVIVLGIVGHYVADAMLMPVDYSGERQPNIADSNRVFDGDSVNQSPFHSAFLSAAVLAFVMVLAIFYRGIEGVSLFIEWHPAVIYRPPILS